MTDDERKALGAVVEEVGALVGELVLALRRIAAELEKAVTILEGPR